MSNFPQALVDLVRRTIKKYVRETVFYYAAKIAQVPNGGNAYTLDDGNTAIVLNNGVCIAGEEVLVIKTSSGKRFIYYWKPTRSISAAVVAAILSGVDGHVRAIVVHPTTGYIYVGGDFLNAGGNPANHIAMWNGTTWSALGEGTNGGVWCLTVEPTTGNVVAGGVFTTAGIVPAKRVAMWDGVAWSALGAGSILANTYALAYGPDGTLYMGGEANRVGPVGISACFFSWDGSTWTTIDTFPPRTTAYVLYSMYAIRDIKFHSGVLHVCGSYNSFPYRTGSGVVFKYTGSTWVELGHNYMDFNVGRGVMSVMAFDAVGNLYVGGLFGTIYSNDESTIVNAADVAMWNGSAWTDIGFGTLAKRVNDLCFNDAGVLHAGTDLGLFTRVDSAWVALPLVGNYLDVIDTIALASDKSLYIGGVFEVAGELKVNNIVDRLDDTWIAM